MFIESSRLADQELTLTEQHSVSLVQMVVHVVLMLLSQVAGLVELVLAEATEALSLFLARLESLADADVWFWEVTILFEKKFLLLRAIGV